jgi:hypothetical protein
MQRSYWDFKSNGRSLGYVIGSFVSFVSCRYAKIQNKVGTHYWIENIIPIINIEWTGNQ